MTDLSGKTAIVTGSTSGIGLASAKALAEKGCIVMVTGSRSEADATVALSEIKGKTSSKIIYVQANLKTKDGHDNLCKEIDKIFPGGVDILVNNAGMNHVCPVDEFPLDQWEDLMSLNLTAPFRLIRHTLPKMKTKGWGRIINVSSVSGITAIAGKAPYCASKSGLNGLTRAVALEGAKFGVTCNAICPAWVETPLTMAQAEAFAKKNNLTFEEGKRQLMDNSLPTRRTINATEIADMVVFLCSAGGRSMTGTSLPMDGGYSIQ